jgi:hypothetical protein
VISARLTRPVRLTLAGTEWLIVITHDVLLGLEEMTGTDVLAGAVDPWRLSAISLRALLYLVLRGSGSILPLKQAGSLINPRDIQRIQAALREAWLAAMPDATGSKESDGKRLTWPMAYATARIDLGLSEAEWLGMTPVVLQALFKRRLDAMRREEILHGMKPEKEPPRARELTGEDIIAAMGGKTYLKG